MYGWTQNRGCITAAMVVMGLTGLIGAIVLAGRSEYRVALIVGAFGIVSGSWLAGEYWPYRRQPVHLGHVMARGNSQPALIVPVRGMKSRTAVVAQAAMGVVSLGIAASPGPFQLDGTLFIRLFWLAVAVILAVGVRNGIRRWRHERFYLAFTPSGIVEEGINGSSFVPWDAIESVYGAKMYGQPLVGLKLRDPSGAEFGGGADLLRNLEEPMTGHQRSYMVVGMPVSPDWLISLIQRYLEHKEARAEIGQVPITDETPA
jgi:hypothetical protein